MKWNFMWMCLVFWWKTRLLAMAIVDVLSHRNIVGSICSSPKFSNTNLSHLACDIASTAVTYSAFAVESAIVFFFYWSLRKHTWTKIECISKGTPHIIFTTRPITIIVANSRADFPLVYSIPCFRLPWMHLNTLLVVPICFWLDYAWI